MKSLDPQIYLLQNSCNDYVLNSSEGLSPEDRIYASDIMLQFAKEYHERELEKIRIKKIESITKS